MLAFMSFTKPSSKPTTSETTRALKSTAVAVIIVRVRLRHILRQAVFIVFMFVPYERSISATSLRSIFPDGNHAMKVEIGSEPETAETIPGRFHADRMTPVIR